jgi:aspartyl-tRNA(Asn)/glutamyl-tRNA(Gln) amidotransferase subunit A
MITGTAPTTMLSLQAASELVRTKRISPVELTTACLERIEQLNPQLNAFITVTAELAMEQARAAEAEIAHGKWRGPLHGIPIALKDMIDTEGVRTTAASALFTDRVPPEDAEVVRRLKRAGAVLIGKTNLHEFAYGGSSVISHFGPVRNPADPALIAGGSSGGSAAAVASGMCYAALGTDTAGSIRTRSLLWDCRIEAELRSGSHPWRAPSGMVVRPRWATGTHGGRCCSRTRSDCRIRPGRYV